MSLSRFFFVLLLSFFIFPSLSKATVEPFSSTGPGTSNKATSDPLYADARKITIENAPVAGGAKALPAETKPEPVSKPAQAELKSPQPAQKPAQTPKPAMAEAKQPAVEVKPNTTQTKAATVAIPAVKEAEQAVIDSDEPSEFIKAGDTEVIEVNEEAASAGVPEPVAVLSSQDPDMLKMNTETADVNHIEKSVRYFSVSVKKHFNKWLERSGKYVGLMKSILRENYLPEDLVFLALIESGFNPRAYSPASASGPWQFIRGTATRYGLRIDRWVDERRDPIKSTKAAAAYLKDLYGMFGNWPLAMASYNSGEGNVARAVKRNDTLDFWELRKTRSLPSETKEYVPKFMAAKMIAKNPESYGFNDIQYDQPFEFDEVAVHDCVDLGVVARCCNVSVDEIKDLNPELIRGCTPPNLPVYNLRVPKGSREQFLTNYAALPDNERVARPKAVDKTRYTVRRGDSMKSVARRYGLSVAELAVANNLRITSKLKKGRRLTIPDGATAVASKKASPATSKTADSTPSKSYRARRGDSLESIARRNGMSVASLARINGLSTKTKLKVGQRLSLASGTKVAAADTDDSKPASTKKSASKSAKKKTKIASRKTYKVKNGDTLWSISKRFNVSQKSLQKANGNKAVIRTGQKLVIPKEEAA